MCGRFGNLVFFNANLLPKKLATPVLITAGSIYVIMHMIIIAAPPAR